MGPKSCGSNGLLAFDESLPPLSLSPREFERLEALALRAGTLMKHLNDWTLLEQHVLALAVLASFALEDTDHNTNPYYARGLGHFSTLLTFLEAHKSHLYEGPKHCPMATMVVLKILDERGEQMELAKLARAHWPLIEASLSVPILIKNAFFEAAMRRLDRKICTSYRAYLDEIVDLARRALAVALKDFGPGHETATAEQDCFTILYRGHFYLAECLAGVGSSGEALGHARRALELCPTPPDKNTTSEYNYAVEVDAATMLTGILYRLGRANESEVILRAILQKQMGIAGPLPHTTSATHSIARLRGDLAHLLAQHGKRYEEALTELGLMREGLGTVTEHYRYFDEWEEPFSKLWSLAADCLWLLGREDDTLQWDRELQSWPAPLPVHCRIASALRILSSKLRRFEWPEDAQKELIHIVKSNMEGVKQFAEMREDRLYYTTRWRWRWSVMTGAIRQCDGLIQGKIDYRGN